MGSVVIVIQVFAHFVYILECMPVCLEHEQNALALLPVLLPVIATAA
jgi:hypothetical protein